MSKNGEGKNKGKKRCSKCKKVYIADLKNFKPDKNDRHGLSSWCRYCKREIDKTYSREYREKNPERKKEDNKKRLGLVSKLSVEYYRKYPYKKRAQRIARKAILSGTIKKDACMVCGEEKVHGHHQDYSKPLKVIWLCPKHHKAIHNGLLDI